MFMKDSLENEKALKSPLGGFIGIIIAVLAIFLVIPLFWNTFDAHLALQICFTLLLLSTLWMISGTRLVFLLGLTLVIPFIVFDSLSVYNNSMFYMVIAYSLHCAFLFFAIIILFRKVLTVDFIDTNLIFRAITIYLLGGIFCAKLYFVIDSILPGSFKGIEYIDVKTSGLESGYSNQFNLLYYSFTTLATLGVGDITPLHRLAKTLTMLEAMFGQLFVATVIAKLVSIWRRK